MADVPTETAALTPDDIREIGEALYYAPWQTQMAEELAVSRQTVAHYLRNGADGSQAAALLGLVARSVVEADLAHMAELSRLTGEHHERKADKLRLIEKLTPRVVVARD